MARIAAEDPQAQTLLETLQAFNERSRW